MTDIAEYERRISYALERIGRQVEALKAGPVAIAATDDITPDGQGDVSPVMPATDVAGDPSPPVALAEALAIDDADAAMIAAAEEIHSLRAELETERAASAQMSDRVRALRDKQETTLSAMERRLVAAGQLAEAAQDELTRLKRANLDLAAANRALIEAAGDPAPHLINSALQAEVETLRAARALEVAELDQLIGALAPILTARAKPEAEQDA
ncbi:MAG TPA: hypothetical protein VGC40_07720 [Paenirhodobacter sp.]